MLEVPAVALEPGRAPPAPRMAMGPGRHLAEARERPDQPCLVRRGAVEIFEQHATARRRGMLDDLDLGAVAGGNGTRRRHAAVGAQRLDPGELAADAVQRVVT